MRDRERGRQEEVINYQEVLARQRRTCTPASLQLTHTHTHTPTHTLLRESGPEAATTESETSGDDRRTTGHRDGGQQTHT